VKRRKPATPKDGGPDHFSDVNGHQVGQVAFAVSALAAFSSPIDKLSAIHVMNSRKASFSPSVTGWTRPAPAGMSSALRTVVHRLGGKPRLEGVAQLVSANDAAHSTALRIDIDRPFDDALDGAGGLAGGVDAGGALVGCRLGVAVGRLDTLGQHDGLSLGRGQLALYPIEAPRLDPGEEQGQRECGEKGADHASFPDAGAPFGFRRTICAGGNSGPLGQRMPPSASRSLASFMMLTLLDWLPPRTW